MIGPQYPLSLHRKLVAGELTDRPGQVPNSVGPGLAKMLMGIALLGYSQVAGGYFYPTYMEEDGFFALPYFKKLGYITITGMVYMYKVFESSNEPLVVIQFVSSTFRHGQLLMVPHLSQVLDTSKIKKLVRLDGMASKISISSYTGQHLVIMTSSNHSI